jgi:hypothetical protein
VKHPHPGRVAETYKRDGERLVWVGYTVDPPAGAVWSDDLKAWVLDAVVSAHQS